MVYESIEQLNKSLDVNFVRVSDYIYECVVLVNGKPIRMQLDFSAGFPNSFPSVIIPDYRGFHPHFSSKGVLCLFDEENIIVRSNMADQLIID